MSKTEIRNVIAYFSVVASFVQIRCSLFAVARLLLFILLSLLASLLAAVAYNTIVLSLIFSICSGHSDNDDDYDYDNADGRKDSSRSRTSATTALALSTSSSAFYFPELLSCF